MRIIVAVSMLLAGCVHSMPMQAFTPTTTSDGVNGWRLVYRDFDKVTIAALLQSEMGRTKSCPQGWTQTKEETTPQGFIVLEGVCK
jgi:hypothetical protein